VLRSFYHDFAGLLFCRKDGIIQTF
jgi:hypothetical protein